MDKKGRRRMMKKWVAFVLAAAVMLVPTAWAEGVEIITDESRVSLVCPDGMTAGISFQDDEWLIEIDEEATDWDAVIADPYALVVDGGRIILPIRISAPGSGVVYQAGFGTSENDDAFILEQFANEGMNEGTVYQNGVEIGVYDAETAEFTASSRNHDLMCVQWYDADQQVISTEKMIYSYNPRSDDGGGDGDGGDCGDEMVELPYVDPEYNDVIPVGSGEGDDVRAWVEIPEGMIADFAFDEDEERWFLDIDNDATDWGKVLKSSYDAENNVITLRFGLDGPEGAVYNRSFGTSVTDSIELLEMFNQEPQGWAGSSVSNGEHIGSYVKGVGMFQPTVYEDQLSVIAAQWFDENVELICTEKFLFTVRFSNMDATQVQLNYVPAAQMVACPNLSSEEMASVQTSLANGVMRYDVAGSESGEEIVIQSWLLCPAYTDDDADNDDVNMDDWRFEFRQDGSAWDEQLEWLEFDGEQYLGVRIYDSGLNRGEEIAEVRAYNLAWYYQGEEYQYGTMQHIVQVGEPKPWPEYVEYWEPVSEEQIAGIKTVNAVDGLSAVYEDGILHIGTEDDKIPSGKDLSQTSFTVAVAPPEGAVYYKENRSGGNNIFGFDEWTLQDQEDIMQYVDERSVEENPYELYIQPCRRFVTKIADDLTLCIYLSGEITPVYGGDVNLIYWYDADHELISKQWIVERYDTISRVEENAAYENESQITERLDMPAIVVFESGSSYKYTLRITSYPQEGSDYVYYDLMLVDKNGSEVALSEIDAEDNRQCKIYIPYPDGFGKNSHVLYTIHHLNSKHQADEYFSEDSEEFKVYRTDYGLCIEVNSLSPFVLAWEDAGPLPDPELVLPDALTAIGEQAFMGGTFKVVRISDSCTSIGAEAFADVANLKVYMPDNEAMEIAEDAFEKDSVTMYVAEGSAAHAFAEENGYLYFSISPDN